MQEAQFGSGPDWLDFLQGLNSIHLDITRSFRSYHLSWLTYPLSYPTRRCEQSPQAGVSTQNQREEKLEMGNDVG